MLRRLGAPDYFVELLRVWDEGQVRYAEAAGQVHGDPTPYHLSIPQGAPTSPLRMNALMAAWCHMVMERFPLLGVTVYADDRVIWVKASRGAGGAAARGAGLFELTTYMRDNNKKREFFAKGGHAIGAWSDSGRKPLVDSIRSRC